MLGISVVSSAHMTPPIWKPPVWLWHGQTHLLRCLRLLLWINELKEL